MSLLVTGSIGIDTVEAPSGAVEDVLGGSAIYFSFAATLQCPVRLVGAVGEDFPSQYLDVLRERPIDLAGLEVRADSKTFRWHGRYVGDMNEAQTLRTDLNVLAEGPPVVPDKFRDSKVVFLANTHPALQRELLAQVTKPELSICDTMNLWITDELDELRKTLEAVDGVLLNDGEAKMLTGQDVLVRAGREVLKMGPRIAVIKKGEHGAMLFCDDQVVSLPAYPTADLVDPTGAGDSFAGGMLAHLAKTGRHDPDTLKAGVARGTVAASFTLESFSLESLRRTDAAAFERRLNEYKQMLSLQ